jgi:hypothetical protein
VVEPRARRRSGRSRRGFRLGFRRRGLG